MHKLLKMVILEPAKVRARLADNSPLAQQVIALTKLDPYQLFLTIVNSWFHHTIGEGIADTAIIDRRLICPGPPNDFASVDDLYFQVAELYKEATGKAPILKQEYTISGPLTFECPEGMQPLVLLKPELNGRLVTIDSNVIVYFYPIK